MKNRQGMIKHIVFLMSIWLMVSGCQLSNRDAVSTEPSLEATRSISSSYNEVNPYNLPPFLGWVDPNPNSTLSVTEYSNTRLILFDKRPGVCVSFETYDLFEPGDDLTIAEAVSRLSMTIDGKLTEPMYTTLLTEDQPLLPFDPDTLEPIAQFEGGTNIRGCFEAKLGTGTHTAIFVVRKTSGDELRYEWDFTLID